MVRRFIPVPYSCCFLSGLSALSSALLGECFCRFLFFYQLVFYFPGLINSVSVFQTLIICFPLYLLFVPLAGSQKIQKVHRSWVFGSPYLCSSFREKGKPKQSNPSHAETVSRNVDTAIYTLEEYLPIRTS